MNCIEDGMSIILINTIKQRRYCGFWAFYILKEFLMVKTQNTGYPVVQVKQTGLLDQIVDVIDIQRINCLA